LRISIVGSAEGYYKANMMFKRALALLKQTYNEWSEDDVLEARALLKRQITGGFRVPPAACTGDFPQIPRPCRSPSSEMSE
jgi:hypothetical protein